LDCAAELQRSQIFAQSLPRKASFSFEFVLRTGTVCRSGLGNIARVPLGTNNQPSEWLLVDAQRSASGRLKVVIHSEFLASRYF
jgi:hypothetical protein